MQCETKKGSVIIVAFRSLEESAKRRRKHMQKPKQNPVTFVLVSFCLYLCLGCEQISLAIQAEEIHIKLSLSGEATQKSK
jgi:hypothetical protein